jgi:hypothetical protein
MAIVKYSGGGLAKQPGERHPAKAAKHAVKKHAAKKHALKHAAKHAEKHAAKKHAKKAAKHAGTGTSGLHLPKASGASDLTQAFHHLQRAAAVISLLESESGGDLRALMEHGVARYREACLNGSRTSAKSAAGLLRAAEHLGMAGLYGARLAYRMEVAAPSRKEAAKLLDELGPRLAGAGFSAHGKRLAGMAREVLRQARTAGNDAHLEFELVMAAEGICAALELGVE